MVKYKTRNVTTITIFTIQFLIDLATLIDIDSLYIGRALGTLYRGIKGCC